MDQRHDRGAGDTEQAHREQARAREMDRDADAAATTRHLEVAAAGGVHVRRVEPIVPKALDAAEAAARAIEDTLVQLGVTKGGELPDRGDGGEQGPEYETTLDVARQITARVLEVAAATAPEEAETLGQGIRSRIRRALDQMTAELVSPDVTRHERLALPTRIEKLTSALWDLADVDRPDDVVAVEAAAEPGPETRVFFAKAARTVARMALALSKTEGRQVRLVSDPAEPDLSTGQLTEVLVFPAGFEDLDPSALQRTATVLEQLATEDPR